MVGLILRFPLLAWLIKIWQIRASEGKSSSYYLLYAIFNKSKHKAHVGQAVFQIFYFHLNKIQGWSCLDHTFRFILVYMQFYLVWQYTHILIRYTGASIKTWAAPNLILTSAFLFGFQHDFSTIFWTRSECCRQWYFLATWITYYTISWNRLKQTSDKSIWRSAIK